MHIADEAQETGFVPAILVRNGASDPLHSLLPSPVYRGCSYESDPRDRMKSGFVSEWFSWCIADLFGYQNRAHPSEHGGNKRFNIISPAPQGDAHELREAAASLGGGEFPMHNDATVYSGINSAQELDSRLAQFGLTLSAVSMITGRSEATVRKQILCDRYLRVDAITLACVINGRTKTYVTTLDQVCDALIRRGISRSELHILSKMPVAHLAGPADGAISGFIGNIAAPVILDSQGRIIGTVVNSASDRMLCLSIDAHDKLLFSRFLEAIRSTDHHDVSMTPGDLLFIPNACHAKLPSALHGRERIAQEDLDLESRGAAKGVRRSHIRQFLQRDVEGTLGAWH